MGNNIKVLSSFTSLLLVLTINPARAINADLEIKALEEKAKAYEKQIDELNSSAYYVTKNGYQWCRDSEANVDLRCLAKVNRSIAKTYLEIADIYEKLEIIYETINRY